MSGQRTLTFHSEWMFWVVRYEPFHITKLHWIWLSLAPAGAR